MEFNQSPYQALEEQLDLDEIHDEIDEAPPAAGAIGNISGIVIPLIAGGIGVWGAAQYGFGDLSRPGPGLWPMFVSAVIIALSVLMLVSGRRFWDAEGVSRGGAMRVIGGMILLLLYVFLLPIFGFEIVLFALIFVWLKFLNGESWLMSTLTAVISTILFYILFIIGFGIPMPHVIYL